MKTADYWKTRVQSIEDIEHKKAAACYQEIDANFQAAIKEVENKISVWYQRFADTNGISMQQARKLLNNKELAELKWDVHEYIRKGKENALTQEWVTELENASARVHISRYEAMKLQLQQIAEEAYGNSLDSIDRTVREVYRDGIARTAFEIQKGIGVGWDFASPDKARIDKVIRKPWAQNGQNFSSNIWSQKSKLVRELNTTFTQAIITGKDPKRLVKTMSERLSVSKSNAGRLVMTESAYFAEQAQKDCFSDLGVERYQIEATLDGKTSETCRSLDQKVFKMSEWETGVTAPPFHPWCRTTTVPYFGDEEELGIIETRAARDEDGKLYKVPGNMTYQQWQKSFLDGGEKDGLQEIDMMGRPSVFTGDGSINIKAYKVDGTTNLYSQTYTENAKSTISLIEKVRVEYPELDELDAIVIGNNKTINGIGAYSHIDNILYLREEVGNKEALDSLLQGDYFPAKTADDVLTHEMTHYTHWKKVHKIFLDKSIHSDTMKDAKDFLENDLRAYIANQVSMDRFYIKKCVSENAFNAYRKTGSVNEILADVKVLEKKGIVLDEQLLRLANEVLS